MIVTYGLVSRQLSHQGWATPVLSPLLPSTLSPPFMPFVRRCSWYIRIVLLTTAVRYCAAFMPGSVELETRVVHYLRRGSSII